MIKKIIISLSVVGIFYLYSCSPIGILGGATTSTMVIAEGDRTLGTVVDDTTIKINISAKFLKSSNNLCKLLHLWQSNYTHGRFRN